MSLTPVFTIFSVFIRDLAALPAISTNIRNAAPQLFESLNNLLPGNPVVYITGIIGLLAVLVLAYLIKTRILNDPGKKFNVILGEHEAITVLMHPNPDPDAMASALAVEAIATHTGTEVTIQYPGQIRHQENRAFKTILDIDCEQITTYSDIQTPEATVLVDHNTPRGFTEAENLEPLAVIDHHPGNGTGKDFTDVRDTYGATATILTEYLFTLDSILETDENDLSNHDEKLPITRGLATALTYGIQSDTDQLTRGCIEPDFNACSKLFPGIDEDALDRIANPTVSHSVLKVKADAINNIQITGSFGVCNVGTIDNEDALSQAADELMRIEGITAVVVYGKRNDILSLSGRSRDDRVHMGEALQHAIGGIDMASAGGHARMGGGQVPVNQITTDQENGLEFDRFNETLFTALQGDY